MSVLVPLNILSIYGTNGNKYGPLPSRMALCTPDTRNALLALSDLVERRHGGRFVLSDLFRSYDMQLQAYLDYVTKKKKAFSPAPVGSMHESGRAFDISLADLKPVSLPKFWELSATVGVVPIIGKPVASASESWHFECRGSHQKILDYVKRLGVSSNLKPAAAMAMSAALEAYSIERVASTEKLLKDDKGSFLDMTTFQIQTRLIRLEVEGSDSIGRLDGLIGPKTRAVLKELNDSSMLVDFPVDTHEARVRLNAKLRLLMESAFPNEYF